MAAIGSLIGDLHQRVELKEGRYYVGEVAANGARHGFGYVYAKDGTICLWPPSPDERTLLTHRAPLPAALWRPEVPAEAPGASGASGDERWRGWIQVVEGEGPPPIAVASPSSARA